MRNNYSPPFKVWLVALGLIPALGGCYSYHPVASDRVAPGSTVRAQLSDTGTLRLSETFGGFRRTVQGEVVETRDSTLLLLAQTGVLMGSSGTSPSAFRQQIRLEPQDFLRVEARHFERGRTWGLSAALTAGFVALTVYFLTGRSEGSVAPPTNGPPLS